MSEDLSQLPEDRILARMARHLKARDEHPVGSLLWAQGVAGYEACSAELARRLRDQVKEAAAGLNAELGLPPLDL